MNEDAWHFWIADSKCAANMAREMCPPLGKGIDSTRDGLKRYIDEIARGQVTHFLMNVNGQRANFPSKVLEPVWVSLDEPERNHEDWVRTLKRLADEGIDPYRVWIDRCREKGVHPWVSVRMNDLHRTADPKCPNISKLWRQHPELQLDVDGGWDFNGFDYSQPLIRKRMLAFIREVLSRYDADGLELDLIRFSRYLPRGRESEFAPLFTAFIREISAAVRASAAERGHPIALSARVMAYPENSRERGLQVDVWAKEGLVDFVMPCNFYMNIRYDISADDWRAWIGNRATVVPGADSGIREDGRRRLATYGEYCRWAGEMRRRGATDGFYLYNLFGHPMDGEVWNGILSNGLLGSAAATNSLWRAHSHENVEWTESYGFNMAKSDKPRVLYMGASILWGFRQQLHKGLEGAVDLSYVTTSKSVSDDTYDRFLRFWLGEARYDIVYLTPISHSSNDDFELWKAGVKRSLATVRECCPDARLVCFTTTRREKTASSLVQQSAWLKEHLLGEGVPLVDIWQFTDRGDDTIWRDGVHLKQPINDEIGAFVVRDTLARLGLKSATAEEKSKAKAGNTTQFGKNGRESL